MVASRAEWLRTRYWNQMDQIPALLPNYADLGRLVKAVPQFPPL